jgi:hypothetical protein
MMPQPACWQMQICCTASFCRVFFFPLEFVCLQIPYNFREDDSRFKYCKWTNTEASKIPVLSSASTHALYLLTLLVFHAPKMAHEHSKPSFFEGLWRMRIAGLCNAIIGRYRSSTHKYNCWVVFDGKHIRSILMSACANFNSVVFVFSPSFQPLSQLPRLENSCICVSLGLISSK